MQLQPRTRHPTSLAFNNNCQHHQFFEMQAPFPDDVPTAPLLRISLAKLKARDPDELARFHSACEDLGFFYLNLEDSESSIIQESQDLFDVGKDLFELPLDEKLKYNFQDQNSYFGYKHMGASVTDAKGTPDRNEFYNVGTSHEQFKISSDIPRSAKTIFLKSVNGGQPRRSWRTNVRL